MGGHGEWVERCVSASRYLRLGFSPDLRVTVSPRRSYRVVFSLEESY